MDDLDLRLFEVKAVGVSNWTAHVVAADQSEALAAAVKCHAINLSGDLITIRPLHGLLMPHTWAPENRP